eukprot:564578-Rhodomonas_salina.2
MPAQLYWQKQQQWQNLEIGAERSDDHDQDDSFSSGCSAVQPGSCDSECDHRRRKSRLSGRGRGGGPQGTGNTWTP